MSAEVLREAADRLDEMVRNRPAYVAVVHPDLATALAKWLRATVAEGWDGDDYTDPMLAPAVAVARSIVGKDTEDAEVPICGCPRHEFDHYREVGCP